MSSCGFVSELSSEKINFLHHVLQKANYWTEPAVERNGYFCVFFFLLYRHFIAKLRWKREMLKQRTHFLLEAIFVFWKWSREYSSHCFWWNDSVWWGINEVTPQTREQLWSSFNSEAMRGAIIYLNVSIMHSANKKKKSNWPWNRRIRPVPSHTKANEWQKTPSNKQWLVKANVKATQLAIRVKIQSCTCYNTGDKHKMNTTAVKMFPRTHERSTVWSKASNLPMS